MSYSVLISCRNESVNITRTLEAVNSQSVKPNRVLVVDDGSTDGTCFLSMRLGAATLKLNNLRHPIRGVNLAVALNAGLNKLWGDDWQFLLKLDADSVLSEEYVEKLTAKFASNPRLGIASGNPHDEKIWRGRASDGAKMYRRSCLTEVNWFPVCNAFDTLMILRAKYRGWVVASYPEIRYTQTRTMRREKLSRWILSGRTRHRLGFPVWHTFLIFLFYARQKPVIVGSLSMFLAHLCSWLGGVPRPWSGSFNCFVSRYAAAETLDRVKEVWR